MQGGEIVKVIKQFISNYTTDFSDLLDITSLTFSGNTATAITTLPHHIITGETVVIVGAINAVPIASLDIVDNIVSITLAARHVVVVSDNTITINGVLPVEYNGTFPIHSVPDGLHVSYIIDTMPSGPVTQTGFLLEEDFDNYNGSKEVTAIDDFTFTYDINPTFLNSPAQGNIKLDSHSRIAHAANIVRANQVYSASPGTGTKKLKPFMFVTIEPAIPYKNDTIADDITGLTDYNHNYWYQTKRDFSVYIFYPTISLLGGVESDLVRRYEKTLLKILANYLLPSDLGELNYKPTVYNGDGDQPYNPAYITHRFKFFAAGIIQSYDTCRIFKGVPLVVIDGTFDNGMEFKPEFR